MEVVAAVMSEAAEAALDAAEAAAIRKQAAGGKGGARALCMANGTETAIRQAWQSPEHSHSAGGAGRGVTPRTDATSAADAKHNRSDERSTRAFREADATYRRLSTSYASFGVRWDRVLDTLEDASQAAVGPQHELYRAHHAYSSARHSFHCIEESVQNAEIQEDHANEDLQKATEAMAMAHRRVARAGRALREFGQSIVSPERTKTVCPADDHTINREDGKGTKTDREIKKSGTTALLPGADTNVRGEESVQGKETATEPQSELSALNHRFSLMKWTDKSSVEDKDVETPNGVQQTKSKEKHKVATTKKRQNVNTGFKKSTHAAEKNEEVAVAASTIPAITPEQAVAQARLTLELQFAHQALVDATAEKTRAQAEADRAMLVVGAQTAGDWSLAAEDLLAKAKRYRRARDAAAPTLKKFVEEARLFKHLKMHRNNALRSIDLAWQARESARAGADSVVPTREVVEVRPMPEAKVTSAVDTFGAPKVNRTEGPQQVVPGGRSSIAEDESGIHEDSNAPEIKGASPPTKAKQ